MSKSPRGDSVGMAEKGPRNYGLPYVLGASALVFSGIALLLKILYSIAFSETLFFYASAFLCFYVPGSLFLKFFAPKDGGGLVVRVFHSIAVGVAAIPLLYMAVRASLGPDYMSFVLLAMFVFWLAFLAVDLRKGVSPSAGRGDSSDAVPLLGMLIVAFVFLHLTYFTDVVFFQDGFKIRNDHTTETVFHLGFVNVLKHTFPPFFPYASGHDFSHYHLGMHLEMELFNRLTGVDTLRLVYFHFPLLYFFLLMLVPYMLVRKFGGSRLVGFGAGLFMFSSDFSFIPGVLGMMPGVDTWTSAVTSTIWSIFTLNSYLPAVFIVFLCVFHVGRIFEGGAARHAAAFALLAYSAYAFKSSAGLGVAASGLIAGALYLVFSKNKTEGAALSAASAAALLLFAIDVLFVRGGTAGNVFVLDPFNLFRGFLASIGAEWASWYLYPLFFVFYFMVAFGVRALGFWPLRDFFKGGSVRPEVLFLALFAGSGFFVSEFLYIGLPSGEVNKAFWFSAQSLMAGWLLLSFFLAGLRKRAAQAAALALLLALSLPTTVQFLSVRHSDDYYGFDSGDMGVVGYLDGVPADSVVLHPPNNSGPSLASNFSGRQSVINLFRSFVVDWIGEKETYERAVETTVFFRFEDADRAAVLEKYGVDYVYFPNGLFPFLEEEPLLEKVFGNGRYSVYKVRGKTMEAP